MRYHKAFARFKFPTFNKSRNVRYKHKNYPFELDLPEVRELIPQRCFQVLKTTWG